jgi:hypothetical protein
LPPSQEIIERSQWPDATNTDTNEPAADERVPFELDCKTEDELLLETGNELAMLDLGLEELIATEDELLLEMITITCDEELTALLLGTLELIA